MEADNLLSPPLLPWCLAIIRLAEDFNGKSTVFPLNSDHNTKPKSIKRWSTDNPWCRRSSSETPQAVSEDPSSLLAILWQVDRQATGCNLSVGLDAAPQGSHCLSSICCFVCLVMSFPVSDLLFLCSPNVICW